MKAVQGKGKVVIALVTFLLLLSVLSWSQTGTSTVRGTVTDPQAVDDEIHALCEALIASEGRLGA